MAAEPKPGDEPDGRDMAVGSDPDGQTRTPFGGSRNSAEEDEAAKLGDFA